jgi:hypothetical protein
MGKTWAERSQFMPGRGSRRRPPLPVGPERVRGGMPAAGAALRRLNAEKVILLSFFERFGLRESGAESVSRRVYGDSDSRR